jgi:hypothetical protein
MFYIGEVFQFLFVCSLLYFIYLNCLFYVYAIRHVI